MNAPPVDRDATFANQRARNRLPRAFDMQSGPFRARNRRRFGLRLALEVDARLPSRESRVRAVCEWWTMKSSRETGQSIIDSW
jgi:hypothetical protein